MLLPFCPAIFVLLLRIGYISGLASWPDGKYGLLKPKTGCPEEWTGKDWGASDLHYWDYRGWTNKGFIFQVEEDRYSNNKSSEALNIEGYVGPNYILRHFCVKRTDVHDESFSWPQGKYCIYKYPNKEWGMIEMYLDNSYGHATKYVNEFTGNRQSSLALYFSCQTSGNKTIPISLPITKPFYLLPYGSRDCQQVQWMVATSEWIQYQTDNYKGRRRQKYGKVPYYELGDSNHKGITMYYCYYQSCKYNLTDKEGVFQSPGFPLQYPDGQLCSWRIMVPENHTLHVHFTNFSLKGADNLKVYKIFRNGSILLIGMFRQIYHQPLMATSTDLEFVFSSNAGYSSTGFRALYKVFILPKKTTTAPKPQTTTPPPTTAQPTTKFITTKLPTTKQPTTKLPTTKRPITTELETIFLPTTANDNSTTNETCQCNPTNSKNKSYNKQTTHLVKKTFCEETWKTVVMVIPLVVLILIALVIIDIICRWRSKKALKSGSKGSGGDDDGMVVNPTYGRGSIVLDQPSGTVTDASMLNIAQSQSRDDLDDYEDVDYTQLNEIPPPRRSSKRQECHALDADTSAVFYHVLEPPNKEPGPPQSHVAMPVGNGGPDVFYHTLEPPTVSTGPAYQNPSDGNLYTLNPLYEAAENSVPLVEANKLLYDSYF